MLLFFGSSHPHSLRSLERILLDGEEFNRFKLDGGFITAGILLILMILFKRGKGRSGRDLSLLDGKDLLYVLFAHLVFKAVVGNCHVEFSHFRPAYEVIIKLGLGFGD